MKWSLILLMVLCLTGCSEPVYETIADEPAVVVSAPCQQIVLNVPGDAVMLTSQSDSQAQLYECDGYTLGIQTLEAGDLDETLYALTGYHRDELQVIESVKGDMKRYDCVFAAAGEAGLQVCRVCILDDGNYHYGVTTIAGEEAAGQLKEQWEDIYVSFRVTDEDWDINTGS